MYDNDVDLYINSTYMGFFPFFKIQEYAIEYYQKAIKLAESIDWDEIILYAIFNYGDEESQEFISADFMTLVMTYEQYTELCSKLSENCRLFFTKYK